MAVPIGEKPPGVKRVLWLHTQPEHYLNCMLDDLQKNAAAAGPPALEYVVAFSYKGPGWYQGDTLPRIARSLVIDAVPGKGDAHPRMRERYHRDWRGELLPLQFDAAIVAGYGLKTHRELIAWCAHNRVPVAMFSDSNLRSQSGRSFRTRAKRWLKRRLLRPYIRHCSHLLTANRLGVAYWRYYGAPARKIVLCPYYADYARATLAAEKPRAQVLAHIGLAPSQRDLFTAARLVPAKGIDLLIAAARQFVAAPQAAWHFVIAGVGPEEAHLKSLLSPDLQNRFHFVGFQQPADNLALMAHADAFVLPSRYEPHGIVVQEAMAVGTPVIASDVVGSAADLVVRDVSGLLFRSGDAGDLASRLLGLLADPAKLAAMRIGARQVFEDWFARTNPVRIVDEVARRMLDLPHAPRGSV